MNALVLFDTEYGNTEQVARAIATGLAPSCTVQLAKVDEMTKIDTQRLDLLVVGGPTHRHKASDRMTALLGEMPRGSLKGVKVAAFDTRYNMAAWLTGSAAGRISQYLRKLGGSLVVPGQSFFIARDTPPEGEKRRHEQEKLEPGELERAAQWAAEIARLMAT